jgi:hypothetical protein
LVSVTCEEFLTIHVTSSGSRRTVLHEVVRVSKCLARQELGVVEMINEDSSLRFTYTLEREQARMSDNNII